MIKLYDNLGWYKCTVVAKQVVQLKQNKKRLLLPDSKQNSFIWLWLKNYYYKEIGEDKKQKSLPDSISVR